MNIIDPTSLALFISLGVIALSSIMGVVAVIFRLRQDRLPDATAYEDIRERRISEEMRIADLREEARNIEQQIKDKDRLVAEVAALQDQLHSIRLELSGLDAARADIEEVKRQAADVAGNLATVLQDCREAEEKRAQVVADIEKKSQQLEYMNQQLPEKIASLEERLASLNNEKSVIEAELPKLRIERDAALQRIEEARSLDARKAALDLEIKKLEDRANDLDNLKAEHDQLRFDVTNLREHRTDLESTLTRLEARKERLSGDTGDKPKPELLLEDIRQFPACLIAPSLSQKTQKGEADTLADVGKYLKACGLEYDYRTIQAFHTCLKINDHAQITILAGVSGTGKSMLPRRYSEAMGIHFHQIAVEPRWDSPQDLLGFYNYIEQKYRATDLARLLVHMDPYRSVPVEETVEDRRDHMALVLLDEMNLARVEYYFSEFLSRLEVRPRVTDADDESRRKNAMIPIDIRGYEKSLALFPSHNVLFAGTMNDDESTQALSDKVLDRGNIIQFAAPKKFNNLLDVQNPSIPNEALTFSNWQRWIKNSSKIGPDQEKIDNFIVKLIPIMEKCGRPFGHRLRDAILYYAVNYPAGANNTRDIRVPLADQIELRIIPKLRGVDIKEHEASFADLAALIRNDLGDSKLAERLEEIIEDQSRSNGQFVWRGLTRTIG